MSIYVLGFIYFIVVCPIPNVHSQQQIKPNVNQFYHQTNKQIPTRIVYTNPNQPKTVDPGLPPGLSLGDPGFRPLSAENRPGDPSVDYSDNVPASPGFGGSVQPPLPDPMSNMTESIQKSKELTAQEEVRSKSSTRDRIVNLIMSKYRSYERPPDGDNATIVTINMKVLAIFSIDVRTMDYYIDFLLSQSWRDRRLSWNEIPEFKDYNQPLISTQLKDQVWLPDLFFRNGKGGYLHKLTLPNYLLRVYPNGNVLYSQKITMRFSCQMHLQTFPMDVQRCHMDIGSYAYKMNELKFVWREVNSIVLADKLQLSEFETPAKFDTHDCSGRYVSSRGQYTCLNATFDLQRQLGSYLATTYIPNGLIIMVSWLSFWVNVDSAPARVPLGLLSLLGILTQAISLSSNLPRVSYIKAIDIWMIFSIIFVIGVLVEYAVALTVLRRKHTETWHEEVKDIVREELARWSAVCQQQQLSKLQNSQGLNRVQLGFGEELEYSLTSQIIDQNKDKSKPRRPPGLVESDIDNYSRFLFPACFVLYNCFYWCYYLLIVNQFEP